MSLKRRSSLRHVACTGCKELKNKFQWLNSIFVESGHSVTKRKRDKQKERWSRKHEFPLL